MNFFGGAVSRRFSDPGADRRESLRALSNPLLLLEARREVGTFFLESDFFIQAGEALAPNEWKCFGPTSTPAANPIARMLAIQR